MELECSTILNDVAPKEKRGYALNILNQNLFCGTNWSWTESPVSYPAPDYSLQLILKQGSSQAITLDGAADGSSFVFTRSASQTSALTHGSYAYQFIAAKGTDKYLVGQGTVQLLPLLSASGDTRSYWEIIRDNAKEAYKRLSSREVDSVTTDAGDTVTYADRAVLLGTIKRAEREIARENGSAGSGIIKSRFV